MHILALGQSNVASHGRPKAASAVGRLHWNGDFLPLNDPLQGGTGRDGSVWTRVAPRLAEAGLSQDPVFTVLAQGGTAVADWAPGGKCFAILEAALPTLLRCLVPVSHVVFHQGERDTLLGTDRAAYRDSFAALKARVDADLPVPWILCRASYRFGVTSAEVRAAQVALAQDDPMVVSGPDTDQFGSDCRHDDTHFNALGLDRFAAALVASLSPADPPFGAS
ncbi:MAG: hypothetical protein KDK53_10760 [Maritimibacter sp.]|nr:hypothetical protein [Maritimibacter sp.]